MSNKAKIIVLLISCLLVLLIGQVGWSLIQWIAYQSKEQQLVENSKLYVPAAYCATDIDADNKITAEQIELRHVKVQYLPANCCNSIYIPLGRKLERPKKKGEPLCLEDFGLLSKK